MRQTRVVTFDFGPDSLDPHSERELTSDIDRYGVTTRTRVRRDWRYDRIGDVDAHQVCA